jgi:hypothetical protein
MAILRPPFGKRGPVKASKSRTCCWLPMHMPNAECFLGPSGLQEKCPVKINTGDLIKQLRSEEMAQAPKASKAAMVSHP